MITVTIANLQKQNRNSPIKTTYQIWKENHDVSVQDQNL